MVGDVDALDTRALQFAAEVAYVLVFVFALLDLIQHRRRYYLDVVLLFGSLAIVILLQDLIRFTGWDAPWMATIGGLCILAQPYLLLRLVEHARSVPRWQHAVALGALVASWVLLLQGRSPLSTGGTLAIILAFVC